MPGATPVFGIPYPFVGEVVDPSIWQDFAETIDGLVNGMETTVAGLLDRPAAWVTTNSQAMVINTETTVSFSSIRYDNDGMFSLGTPTQFTVVTPGVYLVHIDGAISDFATLTSWRIGVFQNGVRKFAERKNEATSGGFGMQTSLSGLIACQVGDTIQHRGIWTGTGGPGTAVGCSLQAFRICPLTVIS